MSDTSQTDVTQGKSFPAIRPLGLDRLLVSFAPGLTEEANRAALAFGARLREAGIEGVTETGTSLVSTLVGFDPSVTPHERMEEALNGILAEQDWTEAPLPEGRRLWKIPACFQGEHAPQLDEAADLAGMAPDEAVGEITGQRLRALALGYAPGQPYLGTLPDHWNLARQKGLTPTVPGGAVVTAVRQVIIFTADTPTGWRQIGRSRFRTFRPAASDADGIGAIALRPGDEVQLRPVTNAEMERLDREDDRGLAGASVEEIQ